MHVKVGVGGEGLSVREGGARDMVLLSTFILNTLAV